MQSICLFLHRSMAFPLDRYSTDVALLPLSLWVYLNTWRIYHWGNCYMLLTSTYVLGSREVSRGRDSQDYQITQSSSIHWAQHTCTLKCFRQSFLSQTIPHSLRLSLSIMYSMPLMFTVFSILCKTWQIAPQKNILAAIPTSHIVFTAD